MQTSDLASYSGCFDFLIANDGNMNIIEAFLSIIAGENLNDTYPNIGQFFTDFYSTLAKI